MSGSERGRSKPYYRSLDVTDPASVEALAAELRDVSVIVHSAGGALGQELIAEADEERWRTMYESNVLGVMRVTKALLPALERSGAGHIVVLGSVAGVEVYRGGAGYTAAKHAVHALTQTLRLELLEKEIRVTEIAPGMVETEFSLGPLRWQPQARRRRLSRSRAPAGRRRGRADPARLTTTSTT